MNLNFAPDLHAIADRVAGRTACASSFTVRLPNQPCLRRHSKHILTCLHQAAVEANYGARVQGPFCGNLAQGASMACICGLRLMLQGGCSVGSVSRCLLQPFKCRQV